MFKPPSTPLVTTWTLWKRLLTPPTDPLFKRARKTPATGPPIGAWLGWLAVPLGILACCGTWVMLLKARSAAPLYLLIATGLASTVYAGTWAVETSVAIARQQIRGTYDMLGVTPAGPLGVHWALCAASLYRGDRLDWIEAFRRSTTIILTLIFALIDVLVASQEPTPDFSLLLSLLVEQVAIAAAIYLDHAQATVLGCLVGMGVPLLAGGTAGTRLWSGLGFLGLQFGALVAALVGVILAAPLLPPAIGPLPFGLLAFLLIREGIVIGLWHALARRLGTDPTRLDLSLG